MSEKTLLVISFPLPIMLVHNKEYMALSRQHTQLAQVLISSINCTPHLHLINEYDDGMAAFYSYTWFAAHLVSDTDTQHQSNIKHPHYLDI